MIAEKLDVIVEKKIFKMKPDLVAHNFFSGDNILRYLDLYVIIMNLNFNLLFSLSFLR